MYAESKENYLMMGLNPFLFSVTYFLLNIISWRKATEITKNPLLLIMKSFSNAAE